MKNNTTAKRLSNIISSKICISFILIVGLLYFNHATARSYVHKVNKYSTGGKTTIDTEKKVDYLEQIYFSGGNKADLNNMILRTIQSLEGQPTTKAVAKQYVFLFGIKDKANAADNACGIEEILAVGIYNIDVDEALRQNIPKPNTAAVDKANDALKSVSDLTGGVSNLNAKVFTLNNGNYKSYNSVKTFYKVGVITSSVNNLAQATASGKQVVSQAKDIIDLFKKDKPCKSVSKKDITLGSHSLPDTIKTVLRSIVAGTKIIIKNINYNQFSSIKAAIQKINGVSAVNDDDFSNSTAAMLVVNNMKTTDLVDRILQFKNGLNFNVESITANTATLSIR